MENSVVVDKKQYQFSKDALKHLLSWYAFSILGFMAVIMLYQLLTGGLSYALEYKTVGHFGKIDSLPHTLQFWNGSRVIMLYVFPQIFMLVLSAVLLGSMVFGIQKLSFWSWFKFWFMIFGMLLSTTLMSLTLFSPFIKNGSLFQGLAVVSYWYGWNFFWSIALFTMSALINFLSGFLCSAFLMYLSPSGFFVKRAKKNTWSIVLNTFIYTVITVFLVAEFLSYPDTQLFFVVLFCHALLWLPGLMNISNDALMKRSYREALVMTDRSYYILFGTTVALVIFLRLLFIL